MNTMAVLTVVLLLAGGYFFLRYLLWPSLCRTATWVYRFVTRYFCEGEQEEVASQTPERGALSILRSLLESAFKANPDEATLRAEVMAEAQNDQIEDGFH